MLRLRHLNMGTFFANKIGYQIRFIYLTKAHVKSQFKLLWYEINKFLSMQENAYKNMSTKTCISDSLIFYLPKDCKLIRDRFIKQIQRLQEKIMEMIKMMILLILLVLCIEYWKIIKFSKIKIKWMIAHQMICKELMMKEEIPV